LSEGEWRLVRPVFQAWLFIGVKEVLSAHYGAGGPTPDLRWQIAHLGKESPLVEGFA
jgi:hypothetical protein